MRFFLNGEDLGPAFSDFKCAGIIPALSINMRQSVRLNFGEHLFLYPPDVALDGYSYRSIAEAFFMQNLNLDSVQLSDGFKSLDFGVSEKVVDADEVCKSNICLSESSGIITRRVTAPTNGAHDEEFLLHEDEMEDILSPLRVVGTSEYSNVISNSQLPSHRMVSLFPRAMEEYKSDEDSPVARPMDNMTYLLNEDFEVDNDNHIPVDAPEENNFVFESKENESGSDYERERDDDSDEDEDEDSDEDDEDSDEENPRENNQSAVDLRRQTMIEHLVSLGFPIEWVLRAAETCDANTPEASVVSWILERMETEHSRLNDGNGDSSRAIEGEINGNEAIEIRNNHHPSYGLLAAVLNNNNILNDATPYGVNNFANESKTGYFDIPSSLSRNDGIGAEQGLSAGNSPPLGVISSGVMGDVDNPGAIWLRNLLGRDIFNSGSPLPRVSSNSMSETKSDLDEGESVGIRRLLGLSGKSLGSRTALDEESDYVGNRNWNNPGNFRPPVVLGRYFMKKRHDTEKEDVLSQISNLEYNDKFPIIVSCEFALCVSYSRLILMRLFSILIQINQLISSEHDESEVETDFLVSVLNEIFSEEQGFVMLNDCLKLFLKQGLTCESGGNSERLFPSTFMGNVMGEAKDRVPCFSPFISNMSAELENFLQILEFRVYSTSIGNSLSVEDYSCKPLSVISSFLGLLVKFSERNQFSGSMDSKVSVLRKHSQSFLNCIIQDSVTTIEVLGVHNLYGNKDWISSALSKDTDECGVLLNTLNTGLKLDTAQNISVEALFEVKKNKPECNYPLLFRSDSSKPFLLYCFYVLNGLLQQYLRYRILKIEENKIDGKSENTSNYSVFDSGSSSPISSDGNCMKNLISSAILGSLLKAGDSGNISVNFIVYELGSRILSLVNEQLNSYQSKRRKKVCDYILQQSEENKFDGDGSSNSPDPKELHLAAEYYVSVTKERKILRLLSSRLKQEAKSKLYSPYTRSICKFLFQWNNLRKVLGLHAENCIKDSYLTELDADNKNNCLVWVEQLSSSSITIAWNFKHFLCTKLRMNIKSASNMGLEDSIPFFLSSELQGVYRIDGLESNTLYLINVLYESDNELLCEESKKVNEGSPNVEDLKYDIKTDDYADISFPNEKYDVSTDSGKFRSSSSLTLFASTYCEPLYLFDHEKMSPHLIISNGFLTVRNRTNKKWSTVRSDVRMTSGIYSWDVHIDKCVSKNIFIGVCTEDAKLDNYTGCDKYGWAFLANKAIWHNKGKLKSYGELFRTGEVITVLLDMDAGTMEFSINGRSYGLAVEGLKGQILYPSFSLYNEDDQLTLLSGRSHFSMGKSSLFAQKMQIPNRGVNTSANSAERIIDRVLSFQLLASYLAINNKIEKENQIESNPSEGLTRIDDIFLLPRDLRQELYVRYSHWSKGISIFSMIDHVEGDYVSVVASDVAIVEFFKDKVDEIVHCGDQLLLNGRVCIVLGTIKQELCLQIVGTGEIVRLTRSSLNSAIERKGLRLLPQYGDNKAPSNPSIDISNNISLDSMVQSIQCYSLFWTCRQDELLVQWVEFVAKVFGVNPLFLSKSCIRSVIELWVKCSTYISTINSSESFSYSSNGLDCFCVGFVSFFEEIFENHSMDDIIMRILLIQHYNDLAIALLPLIVPLSGDYVLNESFLDENLEKKLLNTEFSTTDFNYPTHGLLFSGNFMLFSQYLNQICFRMSAKISVAASATADTENSKIKVHGVNTVSYNVPSGFLRKLSDSWGSKVAHQWKEKLHSDISTPKLTSSFAEVMNGDTIATVVSAALMNSESKENIVSKPKLSDVDYLGFISSMNLHALPLTGHSSQFCCLRNSEEFGFTIKEKILDAIKKFNSCSCSIASVPVNKLNDAEFFSTVHCNTLCPKIFYIQQETSVARQLVANGIFKDSHSLIINDPRWQLVSAIQCSLVGQLRVFLEMISYLPINSGSGQVENSSPPNGSSFIGSLFPGSLAGAVTSFSINGTPGSWENMLRSFFEWNPSLSGTSHVGFESQKVEEIPLFRYESIGLVNHVTCVVPFIIRLVPSDEDLKRDDGYANDVFSVLNEVDSYFEDRSCFSAQSSRKLGEINDVDSDRIRMKSFISEWYILELFIVKALEQVQIFLDRYLFSSLASDAKLELLNSLTAGEISMFLQFMQMSGVCMGLALRMGITPQNMNFSICQTKVLTGGCASKLNALKSEFQFSSDFENAILLSIRTGILSVYPEVALKLYSSYEFQSIFCPAKLYLTSSLPPGFPVRTMYRYARYESGISPANANKFRKTLNLFWVMLAQLSNEVIARFLHKIWEKYDETSKNYSHDSNISHEDWLQFKRFATFFLSSPLKCKSSNLDRDSDINHKIRSQLCPYNIFSISFEPAKGFVGGKENFRLYSGNTFTTRSFDDSVVGVEESVQSEVNAVLLYIPSHFTSLGEMVTSFLELILID